MKTIAVIPARMGSTRFPGKPLAKLLGRSMLEHVYKRVALSRSLDATYIATCDEEIRRVAEDFGAPVIMTADTHERASDRVAEAVAGTDAELIVMVQGDEPMTHPEMVDAAIEPFRHDPALGCVNLVRPIDNQADFRILTQSRWSWISAAMPFTCRGNRYRRYHASSQANFPHAFAFKQVCIIPFRRQALLDFARLPSTPLEKLESVDMLRLLEHGYQVKMVRTEFNTQAVDTQADLERVAMLMKADPLLGLYWNQA